MFLNWAALVVALATACEAFPVELVKPKPAPPIVAAPVPNVSPKAAAVPVLPVPATLTPGPIAYPGMRPIGNTELGPRPNYLVNDMDDSPVKDRLLLCAEQEVWPSRLAIGHRGGGTLQFPEETIESINAGTRMGAAIHECDVVFTKDRQLVCRHDQCDLHETTNILTTELGKKCSQPFSPAVDGKPASAKCCTSDITLAEFKTLCGKMEGFNASATTPEDFLHGTPRWRTDLYSTCGTVISHKEFIKHVMGQGFDMTPELKLPVVPMPFDGDYTYEAFAKQLVDEYRQAKVPPAKVWPQSFQFDAILYWQKLDPEFAHQAVLLDRSADTDPAGAIKNLTYYRKAGLNVLAPAIPNLVTLDSNNKYAPSAYAVEARKLGFRLWTWTLERSGPLTDVAKNGDYYYSSIANKTKKDGDLYPLVDFLVHTVGVVGIFTDWASTLSLYATCWWIMPGSLDQMNL